MALQSAHVSSIKLGNFVSSFQALISKLNPSVVRSIAEEVAEELLSKAIVSPVPKDTGVLERSAGMRWVDKKLVFGFGEEYASIQNYGSWNPNRLPAKPYRNAIGPNYYFSKTLDLNLVWTFNRFGEKVKERLMRK
jgi:hypothetical protein